MQKADKKDDVLRSAFNQYFGLDFTGLVLNEIREKRSMAYTAYAFVGTQGIAGQASYLRGYIGTQKDVYKRQTYYQVYPEFKKVLTKKVRSVHNYEMTPVSYTHLRPLHIYYIQLRHPSRP